MIRVTAFYPNTPGSRFDVRYYVEHHVPLVRRLVGAALKGCTVDEGVAGVMPPGRAPYHLMAHYLFDSMESFQAAFGPAAAELMADTPNFTDLEPVIQASAVRA